MAREQRRLAAIVCTDVVGFSRLIGVDEADTLARLRALRRELIDPKITEHGGRIVKTTGDGLLVEFGSVVDAVRCAVTVQQEMAQREAAVSRDRRIELRVGIHMGDIVIDGDDILGDGVNVAARLEALAEPGGVCVSGRVQEDLVGKLELDLRDGGEQTLKNITRPVRVWRWSADSTTRPPAVSAPPLPTDVPLPLPDKPSIAVLPFQNMSGDPEQEYFADGMVEEIIRALSRSRGLFVIARNSSFTYRGRAVDVRQVGRELGVRYVMEGSVRKTSNRVRIASQLIDTKTGTHLWTDRFDGDLDDVFELQDQVASRVAAEISPAIEMAEIARASRKTSNLAAYDYYLRALAAFHRLTPNDMSKAIGLATQALALDQGLTRAYAIMAAAYNVRVQFEWSDDRTGDTAKAEQVARRALELDENDPLVLVQYGQVLGQLRGRVDEALVLFDRALEIDPNFALAWMLRGVYRGGQTETEGAIDDLHQALRLNPRDPSAWIAQHGLAWANFVSGRYDVALRWATTVLQAHPKFGLTLRVAIAANSMLHRLDKARELLAEHEAVQPGVRLSALKESYRQRVRPEFFDALAEGLRRAGMPE